MKKLAGKVALVTGGNSGIGLATAKLFRDEGATVIVTARTNETFEKAQTQLKGSGIEVIKADVSRLQELENLYAKIKERHGGLDIVFANAGIAHFRPTSDSDEKFFDQQFDTNVKGLYFTVQNALPLLRQGSTVILNASVVAGKGIAGASVYSATKAAVRSFARSWTAEIPVSHVRFNVLSPGPIETPIYEKMGMPADQLSGFATHMSSLVPAKRFGSADEVAKAALFLASADSSYVAGVDLLADGGFGSV